MIVKGAPFIKRPLVGEKPSNGELVETVTYFSAETPEGGIIKLCKWPEGYVLWYHGEIAWKSWGAVPRQTVEVKCTLDSSQVQNAIADIMAKMPQNKP